LEPYEERTVGVNYDPHLPSTIDLTGREDQESVSSAPMHFAVSAEVGGSQVEMIAPMATCGSGCRRQMLVALGDEEGIGADVIIVRFAKFGRTELPDGSWMTWLIVMEDGDTLSGPLRLPAQNRESSKADYPGRLSLGGRMLITVRIGNNSELRLRSRTEPVLSGAVAGWPPYGMQLELENGPIEYFTEDTIDDNGAEPLVRVTENRVLLGTVPHPILSRTPEITEATRNAHGGASVTWTDTATEFETDPPITAYHVYRNADPGNVMGWELAARLPVSQTSWDDDPTFTQETEYLLVHVARCPFDYDLEGLLGQPASVSRRS
jgi:hypothetical protein